MESGVPATPLGACELVLLMASLLNLQRRQTVIKGWPGLCLLIVGRWL